MKHPNVLFIAGATATGKSDLAIKLAQKLNGEIINADSMQIYRGMDIGTGKPSLEERTIVPHHMFDIVEPYETFNVVKYQKMAQKIILEILNRKRLPIVVGGTGLYVSSLLYNTNFVPAGNIPEYREQLTNILKKNGNLTLFRLLEEKAPKISQKLHPNDSMRVIRALELIKQGVALNDKNSKKKERNKLFNGCLIVLNFFNRDELYKKINNRVDLMFEAGLPQEAEKILKSIGPTASQAIGYKEFINVASNLMSLEEVKELIKKNSRHYAKRQVTWFNKMKEAYIIDAKKTEKALKIWNEFISHAGEKTHGFNHESR